MTPEAPNSNIKWGRPSSDVSVNVTMRRRRTRYATRIHSGSMIYMGTQEQKLGTLQAQLVTCAVLIHNKAYQVPFIIRQNRLIGHLLIFRDVSLVTHSHTHVLAPCSLLPAPI